MHMEILQITSSWLTCREFLEAGRSLGELAGEWQSSLPRGLQALVAASCSSPLPQLALVSVPADVHVAVCLRQ